jgi:anaphase-promoting complex subunit 5
MDLQKSITTYHNKGIRDSAISSSPSDIETIQEQSICKTQWSSKQAEIFISHQSALLENDEVKALKPKELQKKIDEIIKIYTPLYSKAYFLSYLNNVRVRDFPNSLEAIHRSFDQNQASKSSENQDLTNRSHFQSSLLNLAILHTMFEQNEEALKCLRECIMVAQENGDRVCLQLAQLWLCLLDKKNFQLSEKNIANKTEKTLVRSVSLNIQSLVKVAALSGYLPAKLFDVLVKSDILNCQHSIMNLISNCIAERAALWTLYGKNEMASLCSQMLLNSNLKVMDKTHHGEGLCQAYCNMALWLSYQGEYSIAMELITKVKAKFPRYPISRNCLLIECYMMSIHAINLEKWNEAATACDHLYHIDKHLSILQRANSNIAKGNRSFALELLDLLLNDFSGHDEDSRNTSNDEDCDDKKIKALYKVRALVMQSMCMSTGLNISSESLLILNRAAVLARDKYLDYEHSMVNIHISYLLLNMNMANDALKVIKLNMENVLANGGLYDKGKVLFLFCQCIIAVAPSKEDKLKCLCRVKDQLELAVNYFTKLECWRKVKAIYVYLAKLYNELGMNEERNHSAYKFRLIAEEYTSSSNENIDIFY